MKHSSSLSRLYFTMPATAQVQTQAMFQAKDGAKLNKKNLPLKPSSGQVFSLTTTFKAITNRNVGKLQEDQWQKSDFNCEKSYPGSFINVCTEWNGVPLQTIE